ncbi:MAG TPA: S41 family peptidase [Gemmataceae bacterium]|jgi:C-terminal peptidase prc
MKTDRLAWFAGLILASVVVSVESPAQGKDDGARHASVAEAARQAWAITDLVLEQDIDPPARQQMLLQGIKALRRQSKGKTPSNLAERVSSVTTPEQFSALLAELWPSEANQIAAGWTDKGEHILFNGLLAWRMDGEDGQFYLTPQDAIRYERIAGNRYVGTGIQIRINEKQKLTEIVVPFPGGPARKAGARPGDLIVEVDGKSVEGLPLAKVVERLQGEEGTKVSMTVRQPGQSQTRLLPMVRSIIPFTSVHGYRRTGEESWTFTVDPSSAIGYLSFDDLKSSTLLELRKIEPLVLEEGTKALVLDLRFTRGDDIRHAALVADGLLDSGVLWRVCDNNGRKKEYKADRDCLFRDTPMVVLVGEHTGSKAAAIAAALQDRGRAIVVGESPKVELTVTSLVRLPDEAGAVILRTGLVERVANAPSTKQQRYGASEHRLAPDHLVAIEQKDLGSVVDWRRQQESPEPKADAKPPLDPQLQKAIALLREAVDGSRKKDNK